MDRLLHIIQLLYRYLTHTSEPSEDEEVKIWSKESDAHQHIIDRLSDGENLKREFARRSAISSSRPFADMQGRIARDLEAELLAERSASRFGWDGRLFLAAASLVLVLGFGVLYYATKASDDHKHATAMTATSAEIKHGEMRALLTLATGESYNLGKDLAGNNAVFATAERMASNNNEDARNLKLTTPQGGEFNIVLEDGTEVWLNADSKLVYPQNFAQNERRVEVEGEAYFKVKKDADRPFIVTTGGQEVKVYGTEFNINTFGDDGEIFTTLVSGKVSLRPVDGSSGELILTPGHQAVFADDNMTVKSVDTDVVTSWRQGKFVFENQSFDHIMKALARWYDFEYKFHDRSLASTVFMGSVPRYGTFDEVLNILEMSGNIRFKVHGHKVDIYRKK